MFIETNNNKLIVNCRSHDLLFKALLLEDGKAYFKIGNGNGVITCIKFDSVLFVKADKIVLNGIVLSCYNFEIHSPPLSVDLPDLNKIKKNILSAGQS